MSAGRSLTVGLLAGSVVGFALGLALSLVFILGLGGFPLGANPEDDAALLPKAPSAQGDITGRGPHAGYILVVDPARLLIEIVHNEHWGIAGVYLFDPEMEPIAKSNPPVLNVMLDEESFNVEAGRENWDGNEDGGWHFEHDALLGDPERGRLRITFDGKTYIPLFRHVHLDDGHGVGHGHAAEDSETEEASDETAEAK